jgi:hypothetical protein
MPTASLPTTDENPADWARPLYARQVAMLGELAEAGLAMALPLKDQAGTEADPAQAMMAFSRAARAVRLSLMLQSRLIKALEDRDAHRVYLSRSDAYTQRREKQARAERIVERVAEQGDRDTGEIEALVQEAAERLDEDDLYDLLARPVSELVALICHDLGLAPDWPHLAQEAWALEEMAGGETGWPLAGRTPTPNPPAAVIDGRPSG